ncbi:hypothetical protein K4L44_17670 [Halosquirtibacter laminarini]|uniref:Uncharacterized protein n=1 Tax=Halosquirtibacter laminarini TaxID=3374600 RepID=A0AC61NNX0_9BACT|nr:hypothetical protein K4L44_17670 [Prolixibacteraceae bacterium]
MNKKNEIGIGIEKIDEISFYAKPLPMPIEQIHLGENLFLGLGFSFNIDLKNEKFVFDTLVKYNVEHIEEPFLQLENKIVFNIKNLTGVIIVNQEDQMKMQDDFLITLTGVAIGTIRGMLAASTKGTQWAKFPLPILNPKEVIQKMNSN